MKKLLLTLQVFACCSLAAQDLQDQAAASSPEMKKSDPCKKECPKDPCYCFQRGDDPIQGMPMTCKYPAAYNHPANTKVEGCGWDMYGDASYLYWYTNQEGMELATAGYVFGSTFQPSYQNANVVTQHFKYTSGFKVGLGTNLNIDDWVADVEYTYLRQTTDTSSGNAPTSTAGAGVFNLSPWFYETYYAEGMAATNFSSKWKLGLDWVDLTFKRPFYQGRKLVVTPSAGLRASWIRQTLTVTSPSAYSIYEQASTAARLDVSYNNSNSWAIGPRGLVDAHWLIGSGFRFQGNMGGSLLYTRYTKVSHNETGSAYLGNPIKTTLKNHSCLRPMIEANLGLGWGGYFAQNKYHFDLSATYDFNYLWRQNMLKYLAELYSPGSGGNANDLFLHGLTVKARFDF